MRIRQGEYFVRSWKHDLVKYRSNALKEAERLHIFSLFLAFYFCLNRYFSFECSRKILTLLARVLYHESVDQLENEKREMIRERILPEAVQYWEEVLEVANPVTRIRLNRL